VVIGDRTAELDTLRTLLLVLLGGGLLVLAASVAAGYLYAGRALVPIRDALNRQREFAADASHELRTPLAITRAAVSAARLGREDPAAVDHALDDIDAGVDRMASLVDDLLLLARADAEAVELAIDDTDLGLAAAEAAEALEPLAATRGIRIALDVRPAPVRGDERRLRQLAGILIDNAIRHSPDGGQIGVSVREGAELVVEDEGPGIPPEHAERVFERFWRAPGSPSGGTGLGLAIARWIAERHGGTITTSHRSAGPGAAFTVRLPASRQPSQHG
jgi:signal transduction histidine kinase